MKHKILVFTLILLNIIGLSELFAQFKDIHGGHYIRDESGYRFIEPDIIQYIEYEYSKRVYAIASYIVAKSGRFSIDYDNNVPFININWNNNTSDRYLILATSEFLLLYNNNSEPMFYGRKYDEPYDLGLPWYGHIILMNDITASSTFREGNIIYAATPERLGTRINSVWAVEGGVNEKLFVTLSTQTGHLYLSVGYVSFPMSYLYTENSRPKRIRISLLNDPSNFVEYELNDNPNYQRIDIPSGGRSSNSTVSIVIEILEIYRGTKYNHTCINSILGYWSQ